MKNKLVCTLALFALLSGCSATYQVQNLSGAESIRLDRQKSVYVAIPEDGVYETKQYGGSGQLVAQTVAAAFSRHAAKVQIAQRKETLEMSLAEAKKAQAHYAVIPVIAHWEKRATEWSNRPSVMSIRLTIIDLQSGVQLTSVGINGTSSTVGASSPEALLPEPIGNYVTSIY